MASTRDPAPLFRAFRLSSFLTRRKAVLANAWTATLCVVLNMNEPYIVCVCVCVRARAFACERERRRETARKRQRESYTLLEDRYSASLEGNHTHHFRRRGPRQETWLKLRNVLLLRSIPFHVPSWFCSHAPWGFQCICLLFTLFQSLFEARACLRASSRDVIRCLYHGRFKERIAVSPRRSLQPFPWRFKHCTGT